MKNIFRFNIYYFLVALCILFIEILIATNLKNYEFIRSYVGDILVVVLIYYFVLSFIKVDKTKLIFYVLVFAFFIEFIQYFKLADILGFQKGSIAYIVLGNYFSPIDLLCYSFGCFLIFVFNNIFKAVVYIPLIIVSILGFGFLHYGVDICENINQSRYECKSYDYNKALNKPDKLPNYKVVVCSATLNSHSTVYNAASLIFDNQTNDLLSYTSLGDKAQYETNTMFVYDTKTGTFNFNLYAKDYSFEPEPSFLKKFEAKILQKMCLL